MKIHAVGAELFHANGQKKRQADMTKLTVAFRNFANAPNEWVLSPLTLTTHLLSVHLKLRLHFTSTLSKRHFSRNYILRVEAHPTVYLSTLHHNI